MNNPQKYTLKIRFQLDENARIFMVSDNGVLNELVWFVSRINENSKVCLLNEKQEEDLVLKMR